MHRSAEQCSARIGQQLVWRAKRRKSGTEREALLRVLESGTRGAMLRAPNRSRAPLFDGLQNVRDHIALRLRSDVTLAVQTHRDVPSLHVTRADDEHRVHLRLFGALDFAVDFVGAVIAFGADHVRPQLSRDFLRVIHQRRFLADGEDAHLFGREPEREIAGVMLDEKTDEPLVRAERRAMDAQRRLVRVVLVAINQAEFSRHGEIHLVRRQRELAADDAPDLHVNLRAVKRRLVRHLHVGNLRIKQHLADQVLRLLPQFRFVDELGVVAGQARRIVRAEAHDVFLDAENLEILQIHFVDGIELGGELFRRAIDVRIVHVERADAHEAEQFARLLVAVAGAVFGQPQRQIAVTARFRRKNAVMMRAVHGFEVIAFRLAQFFQFLAQRSQLVERGGNLRRRNAGFNGVFNQSELLGFR
jgi:hypothetical protein